MGKDRINDWINEINKIPELNGCFHYKDDKIADQKRLREFSLPVPDSISFDINNIDFERLKDFFNKHPGIFLRIIPDEEGFKKGLKKKYTFGYFDIKYFLDFINDVKKETRYQILEFQEWDEDIYGWILISDGKQVIAEISKNLDNLAHHNEVPLSSLISESDGFRHSVTWIKKDESGIFLENALKLIIDKEGEDYFLKGYFEGTTTKYGKNIFFDYKQNDIYYNFK